MATVRVFLTVGFPGDMLCPCRAFTVCGRRIVSSFSQVIQEIKLEQYRA